MVVLYKLTEGIGWCCKHPYWVPRQTFIISYQLLNKENEKGGGWNKMRVILITCNKRSWGQVHPPPLVKFEFQYFNLQNYIVTLAKMGLGPFPHETRFFYSSEFGHGVLV